MQGKHVKSQCDDVPRWLFELLVGSSALAGVFFLIMVVVNVWRWVAW
nr:MAG TPA: hypothetical protein [Caudoviricetes sp.]